jgi:hypothetical protein
MIIGYWVGPHSVLLKINKKNFRFAYCYLYFIYIWVVGWGQVGEGGGLSSVCVRVYAPMLSLCVRVYHLIIHACAPAYEDQGQVGQGNGKPWYQWV